MIEWNFLPNAAHVKSVLTSLKEHPDAWEKAWKATWSADREKAWGDLWYASKDAVKDAGKDAAKSACLALLAYDNSEKYLEMTPEQVALSKDPAAILMLPAIIAFANIEQEKTK